MLIILMQVTGIFGLLVKLQAGVSFYLFKVFIKKAYQQAVSLLVNF